MRSKSIDRGLLLLGLLLLLVSSYQLFLPKDFSNSTKSLGTLSSAYSVVKTKRPETLDWRDAYVGNNVSENQLIYTDYEASAEISFTEGSELSIGENSLIKITSTNNQAALNIERGIVTAKLEGENPLRLEVDGKEFELSGKDAEIQINLKDKKGEIGVISGDVKVESAGQVENISPELALEIEGDKLRTKEIAYQAISPQRGEIFYTIELQLPVRFSWEPSQEAVVLLSRSPQMEKPQRLTTPSVELTPGIYYWRVEGEKGISLIQSFRIQKEVAPKILRPKNGETVELIHNELILQWQGKPRESYLLEWHDGILHTEKIAATSAVIKIEGSGLLNWRVKIDHPERPLAPWSPWQEVEIKMLPLPEVPSELSPDGFEYQSYQKDSEEVELNWKSSYPVELEIQSPQGKSITSIITEAPHKLKISEAGIYKWRLRSMDSYQRVSRWSEWKSFEMNDLSDSTKMGVQRVELKKPDQLVNFNWKAGEGSVSVFELSRDASFKDVVLKREVKNNLTKVVVPEVGSYYWRSRQFLPDGRVHTSEPIKVIIEPAPAPQKPEKLPNMEVPLEWKSFEEKTSWNLLDLFISRAHADEIKGVATLNLPQNENAKSYHLKIYQDASKENLILDKIIPNNSFEWIGANPGEYFWEYSIIDFWDRESPFSDIATLTVTGREIPPPTQPRLRYPIRATEIEESEMNFVWTKSENASSYILEISNTRSFKKILFEKKTTKRKYKPEPSEFNPKPALHFWRIRAINPLNVETLSNTGRFIIKPPLEKIIIADIPPEWKKTWKSRASIAWTPSMDSYSFQQTGQTGKIDGQALMGIEAKGTLFKKKWIFNTELLRQTGKVFESLDYHFQRILLDATYLYLESEGGHIFTAGLAIGQSTGQEYSIDAGAVKANSVSGASYGPILRGYHPINQNWELQSKGAYILGSIKQMDLEVEGLRQWKDGYYFLMGLGYMQREYELNEGAQSSMKFSLGLGKEF
jgi:hypothetical protein